MNRNEIINLQKASGPKSLDRTVEEKCINMYLLNVNYVLFAISFLLL